MQSAFAHYSRCILTTGISAVFAAAALLAQSQQATVKQLPHPPTWNAAKAADYLDKRNAWWLHNMGSIDHGTACIACHTAFPYALARPVLRAPLKEKQPCEAEVQLQQSIAKRVQLAGDMQPFLNAPEQSRGAESVLNAVVMARNQDRTTALSPDTVKAFSTMWERQIKDGDRAGAWAWFGDGGGGEEPWEAFDSQYWGAAMAAIAVGTLPASYRYTTPGVQPHVNALKAYLLANEPKQSPHNRLTLLWASGKLPGLLQRDRQQSIVDDIAKRQHKDGGWSSADLVAAAWKRLDGSEPETMSDGYATAYAAFVLKQIGIPEAQEAAHNARHWLEQHQDPGTGAWLAASWNKKRDPASDVGKFMSDAATAYAVLALMGAE